jgi:hypothetical protein
MAGAQWIVYVPLAFLGGIAACSTSESLKHAAGGEPPGGGPGGGSGGSGIITGGGTVGSPCSTSAMCGMGRICANGVCVFDDGDCVNNRDCQGDTYCCTGSCLPPGQTKGRCIKFPAEGGFSSGCGDPTIKINHFEARVQCEWSGPPAGDPYPNHVNVPPTPLVANLANDSGAAAEIIAVATNDESGGGGNGSDLFGVIRVLNGQTCELVETVDEARQIVGTATPAVGDLDRDGTPEIVAVAYAGGLLAFKWDAAARRHVKLWASDASTFGPGVLRWDAPSVHDLDDDGYPEVIYWTEVYDGRTGKRLDTASSDLDTVIRDGQTSYVIGDVDADGKPELIAGSAFAWNAAARRWTRKFQGGPLRRHQAFADFGTPGPGGFDWKRLDGRAEIVGVGSGHVTIATLEGQVILDALFDGDGGGAPTIGDLDGDGFPEVAVAARTYVAAIDVDCEQPGPGCSSTKYVRWQKVVQDSTSYNTGAANFDFEGDGKSEVVYADECFTRVHAGPTGDVLFSAYRTSCTWFENPIVADPDRDDNTEIVVGSNRNCRVACPDIDPIDRGIRCDPQDALASCVSGTCTEGFCRCTTDAECPDGYKCTPPLSGTPGGGNTCRAYHPVSNSGQTGVRVLKDRLDRWVSSRPVWNQHAYSVTNVDDDGTIPKSSAWIQNFRTKGLNNYRANVQGPAKGQVFPDITGRIAASTACQYNGRKVTLNATVCNRGKRAVGAALPATFYLGDPAHQQRLCVSYTQGPVPVGSCLDVSCEIDTPITTAATITMVVNDKGDGSRVTVECNYDNNRHSVDVARCDVPK